MTQFAEWKMIIPGAAAVLTAAAMLVSVIRIMLAPGSSGRQRAFGICGMLAAALIGVLSVMTGAAYMISVAAAGVLAACLTVRVFSGSALTAVKPPEEAAEALPVGSAGEPRHDDADDANAGNAKQAKNVSHAGNTKHTKNASNAGNTKQAPDAVNAKNASNAMNAVNAGNTAHAVNGTNDTDDLDDLEDLDNLEDLHDLEDLKDLDDLEERICSAGAAQFATKELQEAIALRKELFMNGQAARKAQITDTPAGEAGPETTGNEDAEEFFDLDDDETEEEELLPGDRLLDHLSEQPSGKKVGKGTGGE